MLDGTSRPLRDHFSTFGIGLESSQPKLKGNYVFVKVNEQVFKQRMDLCKNSLIGRVFLSKGDSDVFPRVDKETISPGSITICGSLV